MDGYVLPPFCFTASCAGLSAKLYSRPSDVWNIFSSLQNTIFQKQSSVVIIILEDLVLGLTVDFPTFHSLMFYTQASGQGSQPICHCVPHGPYSGPGICQVISECSFVYFNRIQIFLLFQPNEVKFVHQGSILFFCACHGLPTTYLHFQYHFLAVLVKPFTIGRKLDKDTVVEFFSTINLPQLFLEEKEVGREQRKDRGKKGGREGRTTWEKERQQEKGKKKGSERGSREREASYFTLKRLWY